MKVEAFDFDLPQELIAQEPAPRRDRSRLLVLDRASGDRQHRTFADLPELLEPGDLIVLNDTRVLPARLVGRKPSGGRVELLLVDRLDAGPGPGSWRCLMKGSRKPGPGGRVLFDDGLTGEVLERDGETFHVRLDAQDDPDPQLLDRVGRMPLPPYIRREDRSLDAVDRERYQTVYARSPGAIAAPTAGLHFTPELFERLEARGVERAQLTLHVGLGTFQPVATERVEEHRMHRETFELPESLAVAVDETRGRGGRVVAVGTTVVRTLEWCARDGGRVEPRRGACDLFIYPGYRFRVVDALLTNFHLPRSTLVMLVSAFAGRERLLEAYGEAVRRGYRFYSYGDAMLVEGAA